MICDQKNIKPVRLTVKNALTCYYHDNLNLTQWEIIMVFQNNSSQAPIDPQTRHNTLWWCPSVFEDCV